MEVLIVMCPQNDKISGVLGSPEAVSIVPRICERIESFEGIILTALDWNNSEEAYLSSPEGGRYPKHCIYGTYGFTTNKDIINSINARPFDNLLTYLKERKAHDDAERAEKIARGETVETPIDFTDYEHGYPKTFGLYQHTNGVICHYFWDYNEAYPEDPIEKITFIGYCTDECIHPFMNYIRTYMPGTMLAIDAACCSGTTPELHTKALRSLKEQLFVVENWEDTDPDAENDFVATEYPVYTDPETLI